MVDFMASIVCSTLCLFPQGDLFVCSPIYIFYKMCDIQYTIHSSLKNVMKSALTVLVKTGWV